MCIRDSFDSPRRAVRKRAAVPALPTSISASFFGILPPKPVIVISPVSYTHLDVYKRQVLDTATRGGLFKNLPVSNML